jgi:hypothetical protein
MAARSEDRKATDAGLTGDKIRVIDPAAAPVETDSESAGVPTPAGSVWSSLAERLAQTRARGRPDTFGAKRQPGAAAAHQRRLGWQLVWWTAALVGLGLAAGWIGFL